jgi:CheY-like chemotaxis protein
LTIVATKTSTISYTSIERRLSKLTIELLEWSGASSDFSAPRPLVPDSAAWYTGTAAFIGARRNRAFERRGLDAMADVVALIDDLFFQAKVIETAKHLGVELRICGTSDALLGEIEKQSPRLILVDLNARSEPVTTIERLPASAREIPLVAFLSHVQTDLAERARAAGCREVMPRSVFTRDLATILARAKSQSS